MEPLSSVELPALSKEEETITHRNINREFEENAPTELTPGLNKLDGSLIPDLKPSYKPKKPLDVNLYATKKTVAQGMMDLALLTANSNQLRYVLEGGQHSGPYFYVSIVLISLSIILQVITGIALILLGRYNVGREIQAHKADRLNNWVVLGVFLITVINVFISSFGIHPVEIDPALIVDATLQSMRTNPEVSL